jgi:DNA modification methylase
VTFINYIENFVYQDTQKTISFKKEKNKTTKNKFISLFDKKYNKYINEFWTSKQRQSNSLHEISYRACFKAELPHFFIKNLTEPNDIVYDPFSGRGTTIIEAALMNRNIIANDINPLSKVLSKSRLFIPDIKKLKQRLESIDFDYSAKSDIDISMFYNINTEAEIVSLKNYLIKRKNTNTEDSLDKWIRMIATNRLTGHSSGFFSVYTLPPNQAILPKRQIKINNQRNQKPEYRDVKKLILKKTNSLIKNINVAKKKQLAQVSNRSLFLTSDARETKAIQTNSVKLTVTSPPFLNIVQYAQDNWLRCWFNDINAKEIEKKITMSKNVEKWAEVMQSVFNELYRITKCYGYVAFEVGEVNKGKIKLEEYVIPLGEKSGFKCIGIIINQQNFTKTSNIWGVKNNKNGTNSNRIVIFYKG